MSVSTAGKGDPYWYEWTVGLLKVVEMLHGESGIESVCFQTAGVKGWDDVAVRHIDGRCEFFQVKHSRIGKNITFGDLVGKGDDGCSLLGDLFAAWKAMRGKRKKAKYVLFTNRSSGGSDSRSNAGVYRPSLIKFTAWLRNELQRVGTIADFSPLPEWNDAWQEWLSQLTPGTSAHQLAFLKVFEIRTNQEDLSALEASVLTAISTTFQISIAKALPLFQALDSALRRWTTSQEIVTAEDAFSAMALHTDPEFEHRAPPPPAPFFASREKAVAEIETALKNPNGSPVVFLCAEPGAGKTSLISRLTNRRASEPLTGLIGLRYFAFRPITPASPLIPPDADHLVRPERLWFSLLSQLRRDLKGKLRKYNVPLRNDLLDWPEARRHVLRIANILGRERRRPFTIAVDGIDHAARAMRYEGSLAKDFFASLPSPDEIDKSPVRFLLAGQPAESYPEYPSWLRAPHPKILRIGIGRLDTHDVHALLTQAKTNIPTRQLKRAVREIELATHGNTLATVFAVQESGSCATVEELRQRLTERHLGDGLLEYYKSIWQHGLDLLRPAPVGAEIALASALCLTAERISGQLMSTAFRQLGLSSEQWHMLLGSLGPLIVQDSDGFRVLHNDVRVFLHGYLSGMPLAVRRQGASLLADYYQSPSCSRWFAHKSLLRLLRDAGREKEWARIFTVAWVFEAAALTIPAVEMLDDCAEALRQGIRLKDWAAMLELTCATESLERWQEKCESGEFDHRPEPAKATPPFPATELYVRPKAEWVVEDLHDLLRDAQDLLANHQEVRARALLERWLGGLTLNDVCCSFAGLLEPNREGADKKLVVAMGEHQILESLGETCRAVNLDLTGDRPTEAFEHTAHMYFEAGWVRTSCSVGPFDSLATCFAKRTIYYVNGYETALQILANDGRWPVVRQLMAKLRNSKTKLTSDFKAQAAWWALQSGGSLDDSAWLDILTLPRFGFGDDRRDKLIPSLAICRALGWNNAAAEPSGLGKKVFDALKFDSNQEDNFQHYKLLFRSAATLGRLLFVFRNRGAEAAAAILPTGEMARLLGALWDYPFSSASSHQDRSIAGQLALNLVRLILQLGSEHRSALVEAAKPVAEKCPVDFRQESVWEVFEKSGNTAQLRNWINRWFADDGWLWQEDAGSRNGIAQDLLPLARKLGDNDLAKRVEERLHWLQITYSGHKEYTYATPIAWFDELARIEPDAWRSLGLNLWILSEACANLGGDDRCAWDLGEALGAAAWASGPVDVWQLLTAEYPACGSDSWFYPTVNRMVDGLSRHIKSRSDFSRHELITVWCLAVGFSRWFNDESIKSLSRLRETIIHSVDEGSDRVAISRTIESLTPGEFRRGPRPDTAGQSDSSADAPDEDLDRWSNRIASGEEVHPCVAASLLRHARSAHGKDYDSVAAKILNAVGVGAPYGWGWYSTGSLRDAVLEIGRLVPDELLWNLVNAAVKYAGAGNLWAQGVSRNLYSTLLSRAANRGAPELRSGLTQILQMHEFWARGGRRDLDLPVIRLGKAEPMTSWTELASKCLSFLLSSRSAEIVESAIVGVQALSKHDSNALEFFIKLADGETWKQHWILNCAEVWSVLFPGSLEKSRAEMEKWLGSGPLHLRLQAWIVLRRLARGSGLPPPLFPHPITDNGGMPVIVRHSTRQLMATPATQRGSMQFVDIHHAAESVIDRVERVTSSNLDQIRGAVAEELQRTAPEDFGANAWPVRIQCRGDTRCSPLLRDQIIDDAFDERLRRIPLPEHLQGLFAQAYLGSDNPWTLRATPIPDPEPSHWPAEKELLENKGVPADLSAIRKKLFLLSTQHGIAEDEMALAARVQMFTYQADFIFYLWWEEGSPDLKGAARSGCPTTMTGRTFTFDFDDWWEPEIEHGKRPVVFAVGGLKRLAFSFPDFVPAKLWRTEFGWQPAIDNPLVWFKGNQIAARYEFLHGDPRSTQSGHPRQPLLSRWVAKKSAWEAATGTCGPFQVRDDIQRFASNVER